MSPLSPLGRRAEAFALAGFRVFPLRVRSKLPLGMYNRVPIEPRGVHAATSDPEQIRKWWAICPNANIGIACGYGLDIREPQSSGAPASSTRLDCGAKLLILDIDGPTGERELAALLSSAPTGLPDTYEVSTARGRQIYLRTPTALGNTVGRLGRGIDTRGLGGHGVAPGSIHKSGAVYVVARSKPIARAPEWLIAKLTGPAPTPPVDAQARAAQAPSSAPVHRVTRFDENGARRPVDPRFRDLNALQRAALSSAVERMLAARRPQGDEPGDRNATLNREAFGLAQCRVPRDLAEPALKDAAREVGLAAEPDGEAAITRTFESAWRAGSRAQERRSRAPQRLHASAGGSAR